jgi:two-component system, NarL family, nitrate/nitrite response regulator NarL
MSSHSGIAVLIADDHPIFLAGLRKLLETELDFRVVGEATGGRAAIALAHSLQPDILLLDVAMPHVSGLDVLQELASKDLSRPRVVLLTASIEPRDMVVALRLGAAGVLLKTAAAELLFKCLRAVMAGEYWIDRDTVPSLIDALARLQPPVREFKGRPFGLTPRELQVLALIATGGSNKYIALQLGVSEETIKHHVTNIFEKTGQSSRVELALFAAHCGLMEYK